MPAKLLTLVIYALIFATITAFLVSFGKESPSVPEACLAGDQAIQAGNYDQAVDNYLDCLDSEDLAERDVPAVYYLLANAYSALGNHRQAIEDYSVVLDLDPDNAWAYNNRCWAYALLQQPQKALPDCDEALRRLPDRPAVLDSRALVYWQLGETGKARDDLTRAHSIDSSVPTAETRLKEFGEMF